MRRLKLPLYLLALNALTFVLFNYPIVEITARTMNIVLGIICLFIIVGHYNLYHSVNRQKERNITSRIKSANEPSTFNTYLYLTYGTVSLSTVIYLPEFPSPFGLFIIIFVLLNLILPSVVSIFVNSILNEGFRYGLSKSDKVKNFLKAFIPHHGDGHYYGESRLTSVEINSIDDVFQKGLRKEIRTELKFILYCTLLLWSRVFSTISAAILSMLLFLV